MVLEFYMNKFKAGDLCILEKDPFIFKGIIIQANSTVEIKEKNEDGTYTVIYIDKEGFSHDLPSISAEDLKLSSNN